MFVCSSSVLCSSAGHTIRDLQPLYSLTDESSLAAEDDDDRAVMKLLDMPNQKCGRILYFQGLTQGEGKRGAEQGRADGQANWGALRWLRIQF